MPIVGMPDGAQVQFPDDMPKEQIRALILQKFPDAHKAAGEEPADHGLSERQKLSAAAKALSPITSYPETYERMNRESRDLVSSGAEQFTKGLGNAKVASLDGLGDAVIGAGKVAIGGLGYVASPINAAYRSIIGQPVEDVTGIPREYTEFATQLATPGIGLTGAVRAPAPNLPRPAVAPVAPETSGIVAAADRVSQVAPETVNVPRAFASDNMAVQRTAQGVRNLPIVGNAIPRATGEMADQLAGARNAIASSYGEGSGPNVASRISRTLEDAAGAEGTAAREATAQGDAAVLADWERAHTAVRDGIAGQEASALQAARASVGDMSPQDMGQTLIARLRQGEQEARAAKERLYGIAGESDAAIDASAVKALRADVSKSLEEQGVFINKKLTPAAAQMVKELDGVPMENAVSRAVEGPKSSTAKPTAPKTDGPAPQSLTEFLASKGGLGPDAELEAIGAHNHIVNVGGAGRRKLTRQGGLPLDYAREAAEEAGYLQGTHKGTSTTRDLLDALDAEMRGNKRYAQGFEGTVDKRTALARSEREQHELAQYKAARADEIAASDFPGDRAMGRPVSIQNLERVRQRLNAIKGAASNDADRRAAGLVMRAYEDRIDKAFDDALFSGSDDALAVYKQARAANRDWRTKFGYNSRDDADRLVNRVVTGEVTPQEFSNWLVGSTQVGSKGVSSRLLTRVAEATGGDAEAMQAIRGGVWNRLTQTAEGVADKAPAKVANDISEFLNGSGRDVANRLLTPQQRQIAQTYADTLRRGAEARATLAEAAANSKPSAAKVDIGPMQELAATVLGKGGKTDEALFKAIDAYAKSGKGDVKTLAELVKAIPEKDKGDLAGALIRNMGHSAQTNTFTLETFASDWGKYSPQAKAVLFGNAGPYRQALDDIAMIAQRYKDVGRRFGNPSGTAQNVSLLGTAAWVAGSPYTAIPAILGGAVASKMLASPAGASSLVKWGRTMEAVKQSPSPQRLAALQAASRNLVNTSTAFGGKVSPPDFMRQLQGTVPAGAQDKEQ